jgi:alpha-beta hydrolase superfamily lysophospholipase
MELTTAAARAGAAIYTIDPRGFSDPVAPQGLSEAEWNAYLKATRDSLAAMAAETMGLPVSTAGDFQTLLTRLAGGR